MQRVGATPCGCPACAVPVCGRGPGVRAFSPQAGKMPALPGGAGGDGSGQKKRQGPQPVPSEPWGGYSPMNLVTSVPMESSKATTPIRRPYLPLVTREIALTAAD